MSGGAAGAGGCVVVGRLGAEEAQEDEEEGGGEREGVGGELYVCLFGLVRGWRLLVWVYRCFTGVCGSTGWYLCPAGGRSGGSGRADLVFLFVWEVGCVLDWAGGVV